MAYCKTPPLNPSYNKIKSAQICEICRKFEELTQSYIEETQRATEVILREIQLARICNPCQKLLSHFELLCGLTATR